MRSIPLLLIIPLLIASCRQSPHYPSPAIDKDNIVIAAERLRENVPVFYSQAVDGKRVNFFVIVSGRKVGAYFDACTECYPKRLGYYFDKDFFHCRACNIKIPLDRIDTGVGRCYPVALHGMQKGNTYAIPKDALKAGLYLF